MSDKIQTALACGCPLFCGVAQDVLTDAIRDGGGTLRTYRAGEVVYAPDSPGAPRLGILTDGKASVSTPDPAHNVLLRFLGAGDLFGIANLFSTERFVSTVRAESDCTCLFLTEETVRGLLDTDRRFRENYICYLAGRVRFLNRKIGYLTGGSAERRLALYLAGLGREEITLPCSISTLSELLDLGRASLYRAFDRLTADGWLIRDGKHLRLTDPDAMLLSYENDQSKG